MNKEHELDELQHQTLQNTIAALKAKNDEFEKTVKKREARIEQMDVENKKSLKRIKEMQQTQAVENLQFIQLEEKLAQKEQENIKLLESLEALQNEDPHDALTIRRSPTKSPRHSGEKSHGDRNENDQITILNQRIASLSQDAEESRLQMKALTNLLLEHKDRLSSASERFNEKIKPFLQQNREPTHKPTTPKKSDTIPNRNEEKYTRDRERDQRTSPKHNERRTRTQKSDEPRNLKSPDQRMRFETDDRKQSPSQSVGPKKERKTENVRPHPSEQDANFFQISPQPNSLKRNLDSKSEQSRESETKRSRHETPESKQKTDRQKRT